MSGHLRTLWISLALALITAGLTGCYKSRALVRVHPDGSGDLVVTSLISENVMTAMMKQFEQMREQFAEMGMDEDAPAVPADPFFNESLLKRMAAAYGKGVTFVEAKPLKQGEMRGSITHYRFEDVSKVFISMETLAQTMQMATMSMRPGGDDELLAETEPGEDSFTFSFVREGEVSRLTANVPENEMVEFEDDPDWQPPAQSPMTSRIAADSGPHAELLGIQEGMTHEQILRAMLANMELTVEVQTTGNLHTSTAHYPHPTRKNTFSLFSIRFSEILDSRRGLRLFSDEELMNRGDMPLAKDVPGMDVETENVVLEFGP